MTIRSASDVKGAGRIHKFASDHSTALNLPIHFIELLLLIEDKRFPVHVGIDPIAMLRALRCNLLSIGTRQGASTLTQQIYNVRIMARDHEYRRTFTRKVAQLWFAATSGRKMTKLSILKEYTGGVYWGRNLWGLDAAAYWYFGKEGSRLNVAEAFFLVERLACPNRISIKRVEVILRRESVQNVLIKNGVSPGYILQMYSANRAASDVRRSPPKPLVAAQLPY